MINKIIINDVRERETTLSEAISASDVTRTDTCTHVCKTEHLMEVSSNRRQSRSAVVVDSLVYHLAAATAVHA